MSVVPHTSTMVGAAGTVLGVGGYQAINQLGAALREAKDYYDNYEWEHVSADRGSSSSGSNQNSARSPKLGAGRSRGGAGVIRSNKSDLAVKPPSSRVPKIPRSIANQIVWIGGSLDLPTITVSSSVVVETNFAFLISQLPNYGNLCGTFDQYFIGEATISFYSQYPSGGGAWPAKLYTALDFDNTTPCGTVAALEAWSTLKITEMGPTKCAVRSVRPCVKSTVSNVANSGVTRCWIDTAQTSINHFGIRSIVGIAGATYPIYPTQQLLVAFRNVV